MCPRPDLENPAQEIPAYPVYATLVRRIFGMLHPTSSAADATSVRHTVYNGADCLLSGIGKTVITPGMRQTQIRGLAVCSPGKDLNLAFFAYWWRRNVSDFPELSTKIH